MDCLGQEGKGWGVSMVEREPESGGLGDNSGLQIGAKEGWFRQPLAEEEERKLGRLEKERGMGFETRGRKAG